MKFSDQIEKALRDAGLSLSDVPEHFVDTALECLITEDYLRGLASKDFERGVITMVVTAAKMRKEK